MILVLKAHREPDLQCRTQAEETDMEVDNLTVANIAYTLVTKRLMGMLHQQLVYVMDASRMIQSACHM